MILYIYTYKKSIETKYIEFYSKRELEGELRDPRIWIEVQFYTHRERERMKGGREGGRDRRILRGRRMGRNLTRLPFDDTWRRGGQGSYVAGESSLTCCRCCCWLCGRCGLTNRSMAVADAEPPPPMIPVANGGPNGFESILATSRDFRFSSFKKAHVDMCQTLLLRLKPSSINTTTFNVTRQQHVSTRYEIFS